MNNSNSVAMPSRTATPLLFALSPFLIIGGQWYGAEALGRLAYAIVIVEFAAQIATLGLKRGLALHLSGDGKENGAWDGLVVVLLATLPLTILLNPRITPLSDEVEEGWEGCLSVPGVYESVTRAERILVEALNEKGEPFKLEAHGLLSVCIQHEMDHLQGKVFVEYLSLLKRTRIKNKMLKQLRNRPM